MGDEDIEVLVETELPEEDEHEHTKAEELEIDIVHSFEMRLKGSMQVSKKVLDKLGNHDEKLSISSVTVSMLFA